MTPPEITEPGRAGNNHGAHSPSRFYVSNDIKSKRSRRTKSEMTKIRDAIIAILTEDHPQTVRQIFYALTVRGVQKLEFLRTAEKSERELLTAWAATYRGTMR